MKQESNVFSDVNFLSCLWKNAMAPIHLHSCFEVVLTVEGTMYMQLPDRDYFIPTGYAVFLEPYERHGYPGDSENKSYIIEFGLESNPSPSAPQ